MSTTTTTTTTTTKVSKTDELLASIANTIIESIEAGTVTGEWVKPWTATAIPVNASTGKNYRGINLIWFWAVADAAGYSTNHWATYKQWEAMGAQVRKGEKGTKGVKWIARTCKDHADDERCAKCGTMFPSVFTVFNADQVDGYEPQPAAVLSDSERFAAAETFFANVQAKVNFGGDMACYVPARDEIHMPLFSTFKTADGYYATLGHEHIHWTGSNGRADRDLTGRFGDSAYAMEELIAELGAAMLCGHLGITDTPRPDHARYLKNWVAVLRNDPKALYTAASKASTAVDYLLGLQATEEAAA